MPEANRITIGQISRVRGVKGEMVVIPLTDNPSRFLKLKKVAVALNKNTQEFLIEQVREFKGRVLLKLKQIDNPEQAEKMVGGFIEIKKEELVELPEGSYFVFDIIGLEVITTRGEKIGKIKEVISLPGNDIYLVEGSNRQYDIPAIKDIVKIIDPKKKEMIIEPPEGLLDL